jgi:hypothetical protein
MPVPITKFSLSTAAAIGTAVLLAACSDQTSAPRSLSPDSPDLAVVSSFPSEAGALQTTINSGSNISYCGYNSTQAPVVGTTYSLAGSCVSAQDLNTALQTYNPGWSIGFNANAAHWIGPTDHLDPAFPGALSNQYVADVGSYQFVTTFDGGAANATNRALELEIMSDNAVVVYLNGVEIGRNAFLQDCPVQQTNCNWTTAGSLKITGTPTAGTNTLRVDLVGTAIGLIVNGQTPRSTCAQGPQFFGEAGFSGVFNVPTPQHLTGPTGTLTPNWSIATCKNPTGVDFTARVYFTPPPVLLNDRGCSPGYWKNHLDAWPTSLQNTTFATIFTAAAGTDIGDLTLLEVLSQGGGGINALGRIAVSAYLNALGFGVLHYGLTPAQVQTAVNAAITSGNYDATKNQLEGMQDVNGRTCTNPTISLD